MHPYSRTFRLLHWAIALTFLFLALTIFLRLTWLNKFGIADILEQTLVASQSTLSYDELIVIAKQIRKPMWDWHIYSGYLLTGLISLRIWLGASGKMVFQNPFNKNLSSRERFQYGVYLVFYLFVAVSLITGLLIELFPKTFKASLEDLHKLSVYYLAAFIVLHLAGVLIAEFSHHKGIISEVISGHKRSTEK
ncbi:cytochrome b/b6 domain-containing protein [Planktosalinus lacus]|uniref:Cytochrome b561 bacterial/Ni-hydrogenase domain-containing protein n=1 Tax=Planktosalinus lacus TaxID=1526573 RepID=A0A8J2VB42_9FLAO|nr:cytochrome b/b6 domain-containing protein [Planktosalinus lacus]GGD94994.1 hypothetical protein GCM10011312_18360 [Planktosalinus lacus]